MKTLSDHPMLIGEILARRELRRARAARRQRLCMTLDRVLHRWQLTVALAAILGALIGYLLTRP